MEPNSELRGYFNSRARLYPAAFGFVMIHTVQGAWGHVDVAVMFHLDFTTRARARSPALCPRAIQ